MDCIWEKIADFCCTHTTLAAWAQVILLLVAALAAIWYAWTTRQQWVSQRQALEFDAFARYAQHHNSQRSYLMRRFIHRDFEKVLNRVLTAKSQTDWTVDTFNRALAEEKNTGGDFDTLEAVECVMLDFDMLAVPVVGLKSESAMRIAEAYRPVFAAVIKKILLFLQIQAALRPGKTLREYKRDVIGLLEKLCILPELNLQKPVDEPLTLQDLLKNVRGNSGGNSGASP